MDTDSFVCSVKEIPQRAANLYVEGAFHTDLRIRVSRAKIDMEAHFKGRSVYMQLLKNPTKKLQEKHMFAPKCLPIWGDTK